MKFEILFSLIFLLVISSCKNQTGENAKDGAGRVTYRITYTADNPYKNPLLPRETQLAFNSTRACFVTSGGGGLITVVNLLDNEKKRYSSLLINSFGENLAFTDTPEDVKDQENNPQYKIETTNEKKTIAGLECRKAIVSDLTNNKKFDIYFYDKVKVYYGDSPYKDFNYLLMEYQHTKYGLPMKVEALKVDLSPVDTAVFSVHGVFNWVDKKRFMKELESLRVPL
jgi:GLPGLI family protein